MILRCNIIISCPPASTIVRTSFIFAVFMFGQMATALLRPCGRYGRTNGRGMACLNLINDGIIGSDGSCGLPANFKRGNVYLARKKSAHYELLMASS